MQLSTRPPFIRDRLALCFTSCEFLNLKLRDVVNYNTKRIYSFHSAIFDRGNLCLRSFDWNITLASLLNDTPLDVAVLKEYIENVSNVPMKW